MLYKMNDVICRCVHGWETWPCRLSVLTQLVFNNQDLTEEKNLYQDHDTDLSEM